MQDTHEKLRQLCANWAGCERCELHKKRARLVFGEGPPDADIMLIGEGPGEHEDKTGRPFVGKSGEFLEWLLGQMGRSLEDMFVTNTVLCRPPLNRDPTPAEMSACYPRLVEQIRLVDPLLIIGVGRVACQFMMKNRSFAITKHRGTIVDTEFEGAYGTFTVPVFPVIHPSNLHRTPDFEERGSVTKTIKDFKQIFKIIKKLKEVNIE